MPVFVRLDEMERSHTAYHECSEGLSAAPEALKDNTNRTPERLAIIQKLSGRTDMLLDQYLDAFKKYYGQLDSSY